MKAAEHPHALAPDELMAYLDGELAADRAAAAHAHVTDCAACQSLASALRNLSFDVRAWEVEPPPQRLTAPGPAAAPGAAPVAGVAKWWRRTPAWALAATSVAALLFGSIWLVPSDMRKSRRTGVSVGAAPVLSHAGAAEPSPAAPPRFVGGDGRPAPPQAADARTRGPRVIRTASLTIVAKDFDAVRPAIEQLIAGLDGFIGQIQTSDTGSAEAVVQATLRVPAGRLDETLRALRTLGHVVHESQSGDDVTEQVMDLEVRLANSRNTERRLTEVLQRRTGDVGDILEVEREIARVRGEIERFEAERLNMERRISYATLTVQVRRQRQATLDMGPQPIRSRLRNAFVDGMRQAYASAVAVTLGMLHVAPLLVLWTVILWWPVRALVRAARRSGPFPTGGL